MKTESVRNTGLALIGLAALTIYILACTSFSPDDKKVLYPSIDTASGAVGVALYDRETSRSRTIFVPLSIGESNLVGTPLLRPQWLADGRRILVSWPGVDGKEDEGLNLAVIPATGDSGVRLFRVPFLKDIEANLMMPLPVSGQTVFLPGLRTALLRMDLATGRMVRHELPEDISEIAVYPGSGDEAVFYLEEQPDKSRVWGRLEGRTFARTPLITFTNELAEGSFFTYDDRGQRIAFVEQSDGDKQLVVLARDRPPFTRLLNDMGQSVWYGNAVFLPRQNALLASYKRDTTNSSTFGLLEIPLKAGPVRDTVLISGPLISEDVAAFYFQAGVSHDGKTAAASSVYLACESKDLKAADCALFFVNLSDPRRKVTKVPIPLPQERPAAPSK